MLMLVRSAAALATMRPVLLSGKIFKIDEMMVCNMLKRKKAESEAQRGKNLKVRWRAKFAMRYYAGGMILMEKFPQKKKSDRRQQCAAERSQREALCSPAHAQQQVTVNAVLMPAHVAQSAFAYSARRI